VSAEKSAYLAHQTFQHFDHSFKGELHTSKGPLFVKAFGECSFAKRPVEVLCKGNSFEIIEELGIALKKNIDLPYRQITALSWDHANSEVKIEVSGGGGGSSSSGGGGDGDQQDQPHEQYVILTMAISVELEGELKLRLNGLAAATKGLKIPTSLYVGMFAGATKPKPFQRKRPNLSDLPSSKLPPLHDMRSMALKLHKGSYRPCPPGESRRLELAIQHIFEGFNSFALVGVTGSLVQNQWRSESVLQIKDEMLVFRPLGVASGSAIEFSYADIADWDAVDNDTGAPGRRSAASIEHSGIEIRSTQGDKVFFAVPYIRDAQHTLEFFWNKYQVENGGKVKLGSTHGRPLVTVATLSGDAPPPEAPRGQSDVVDIDGTLVRPGARMAPRRSSIIGSASAVIAGGGSGAGKEAKMVPPEIREVKMHWHKVVLHQGWLLKKGGVGVGANKSWIKRYFVLYSTSQGHFMTYYSDFTECPLFTHERQQRNIVDLAKTTFIRPGSNKAEAADTPPHSFDIVTTEREWTLCAESQENVQKWLRLITRAVDEDVAILPDEDLVFKVKPKVDPLGVLPASDYSTSLKVSAHGVSVCTPDTGGQGGNLVPSYVVGNPYEREHYFWVYTDFYKWSLISQGGKLALLVNVFADASFSRRNEYIFRNKEAVRLATAIEYFIEKFMSVMHIRLEVAEGAFDDVVPGPAGGNHGSAAAGPSGQARGGLHNVNADEWPEDDDDAAAAAGHQELDLLDLDPEPLLTPAAHQQHIQQQQQQQQRASAATLDIFGDASDANPRASATSSQGFGDDPFGGSFASGVSLGPSGGPKMAPPLTPAQLAQHSQWMRTAALNFGGPLYDDGTLQIASRVEIRGSQGRLTLYYRNHGSSADISDLSVTLLDAAGLLRCQQGSLPSVMAAGQQHEQQIMMECMKPAAPGPQLEINYTDAAAGRRTNVLDVPVFVATFNEPLAVTAADFSSRWEQLTAPGQETQEVFYPSQPVVPENVLATLTSTMKFAHTTGMPDESEYVLYGAASLRTGALTSAGEKISVGCLAKVEMNVEAQAIRVTFRTLHPSASTSMLATIKTLLG